MNDLTSTSRASSTFCPPACASTCAASLLPRIAAQCSGVHPSLSARPMCASMYSSSFTASGNPLLYGRNLKLKAKLERHSFANFHGTSNGGQRCATL